MPIQSDAEAIEAEIDALIDSLSTPVPAEVRELVAEELRGQVERSTDPHEVVAEHIRANHQIEDRDYRFPKEAVEDEAMFLLAFQAEIGRDHLQGFVDEKNPSCEHFPRYASDRTRSPIYSIREMAAQSIETIQKQVLKDALPGATTPEIEAAVARFMERFSEVPDKDSLKLVEDAYRNQLLDSTDPSSVLQRRLSRYAQEDGAIEIPESERLDRAIHFLLIRRSHALTGLNAIATRELSCGDHHKVYAGGLESPGSLIYTAQQIAANTLEEIDELKLERIHLEPLS